jgi:hypothetical protein
VCSRPETGLTDLPQLVLDGRIIEHRNVRVVLGVPQRIEQAMCGRVNIITRVATELDHEKALTCRELLQSFRIEMLDLFVVMRRWSTPSSAIGLCGCTAGTASAAAMMSGKPQHDQRPFPNDRDQFKLGAEHRD